MSAYFCDTPLHTVPYYDHSPYRPIGVHVAAAITAQAANLPLNGCVEMPQAELWHRPFTAIDQCGQGIVILSSVDTTLRILVSALCGSGCNSTPYLECTPLYPLELALRVGRNNIIWCTDSCIAVARSQDIADPWEDISSDAGSVLYFPNLPTPSMKNFVLADGTYRPIAGGVPVQPEVMSLERCRMASPPRITLYSPSSNSSAFRDWLRDHSSHFDPCHPLGHTIRLFHRVMPIAIPPSRCFCGIDYSPGDEDYSTGGPPTHLQFADD